MTSSESTAANVGSNLSVVMLTLNEEKAISKVIADIRRYVPASEIVVVDSSTDQTATIAEELQCHVIRQFPPRGYGLAMDAGLKACTRDYILTLDCDDTYPVESISELLGLGDTGYDLVSASRLERKPLSMPLSNYLANWAFAAIAQILCGVHSTDVHTGMRLYRRSMIQNFSYDPVGMALPVELQVGPAALGYRCTEIFIEYRERIGVSKLVPIAGGIWTLRRLWKWRRFGRARKKSLR